MATRSQRLTLPLGSMEARAVCSRSLHALGWEITRENGRLIGREEAATLCCCVWPVSVCIGVDARGARRTEVTLDFEIVGAGLIQSRQLHDRMRAVCLAVVRELEAPES